MQGHLRVIVALPSGNGRILIPNMVIVREAEEEEVIISRSDKLINRYQMHRQNTQGLDHSNKVLLMLSRALRNSDEIVLTKIGSR